MLGTLNHDDEEPRPTRAEWMTAYADVYLNPTDYEPWVSYAPSLAAGLGHTHGGVCWTIPGARYVGGPS